MKNKKLFAIALGGLLTLSPLTGVLEFNNCKSTNLNTNSIVSGTRKLSGEVAIISTQEEFLNLFANGGRGRLANDLSLTLTERIILSETQEVELDLNGYDLVMDPYQFISRYAICINDNAVFTLKDTSGINEGGTISFVSKPASIEYSKNFIDIQGHGTFNFEGGNFYGDRHNLAIAVNDYATLNMSGGSIKNFEEGVYLSDSDETVNFTGGLITENDAGVWGAYFGSSARVNFGGTIVIKDNKTSEASNSTDVFYIKDEQPISDVFTILTGENAPQDGMEVGLNNFNGNLFYTEIDYTSYFFSNDENIITFDGEKIVGKKLVVTTQPTLENNYTVAANFENVNYNWGLLNTVEVPFDPDTHVRDVNIGDDAYTAADYEGQYSLVVIYRRSEDIFEGSSLKFKSNSDDAITLFTDLGVTGTLSDKDEDGYYTFTFSDFMGYLVLTIASESSFTITDVTLSHDEVSPIDADWAKTNTLDLTKVNPANNYACKITHQVSQFAHTNSNKVVAPAHVHGNPKHVNAKSATCTENGNIEYYECACGNKYSEVGCVNELTNVSIAATGHSYSTEWTYDDTNHWHASTCGHNDEKSDSASHSWNGGVITTNATETSKGVKTYTCSTCGKTRTEDIEMLTHEKGEHHSANPATCVTAGNIEYWDCVNCNGKLDANGNLLSSVVIPATGHSYSTEWSHDNEHHWHASTCGHSDEKSDVEDHTWNAGVVTTNPTESSKGVKTYTCTVCGQTKTEDIPMLNHQKGTHHNAVAATCETAGNVEYWDCVNCNGKLDANGNLLTSTVVPATGHTLVKHEQENGKVGTCGHKSYYECSVCHKYFEDEEASTSIVNINNWKQKGGDGYIAEDNKPVIIPSAVVGGIIVLYLIGYVALYRQGVLDDKKIRAIYKWLPRGKKNRA